MSPVLPTAHRLRRRRDFDVAARRGRRAGSVTLVGQLAVVVDDRPAGEAAAAPVPARVGFVVSGAVGPAVVRNRVRRRLRHLAVDYLPRMPAGTLLVLRALPAAAGAPPVRLAVDLALVVDRLLARIEPADLTT